MAQTNFSVNNSGSAYSSVGALALDLGMCERSTRDALRRGEILTHQNREAVHTPESSNSRVVTHSGGR